MEVLARGEEEAPADAAAIAPLERDIWVRVQEARAAAAKDDGAACILCRFPPGQKWLPAPCSTTPMTDPRSCAASHWTATSMSLAISMLIALK